MKYIIIILINVYLLIACKPRKAQSIEKRKDKTSVVKVTDQLIESAVIYEANIRQYSKEGTFKAFTNTIPELKALGVNIIWVMPIFPISETKRKATGEKFVSEMPDEEQGKYLGSYYAVSNFRAINPEFGTINDFRDLVKTAHAHNMLVILDWVPNHTGWDHLWITTHPEFYTKNKEGEITEPLNEDGTPVGWSDVADLNYNNSNLRKTMIADMTYWISQEGVDGFRCDVAGSVPLSFWQEAIPKLRAEKKLFMLAEAWEPDLLKHDLFDMGYAWDRHHVMNDIAKGEKSVTSWDENYTKDVERYEADDILMTFVTNHDENSWNGTIKERMGEASELFTVLSYVTPGMPLIYSGQEYGLEHRLKFFEKDEIIRVKGKDWKLLEDLGLLKQTNPALDTGKNAGDYIRLSKEQPNILAFIRKKGNNEVVFIGNMTDEAQTYTSDLKGEYNDFKTQQVKTLTNANLSLKPWEYLLLIK